MPTTSGNGGERQPGQIARRQPHGVLFGRQDDGGGRGARGLVNAPDVRRREVMMIAKSHRADQVPARSRHVGKETLGLRDAGDREDTRLRRHDDRVRQLRDRARGAKRAGHVKRGRESRRARATRSTALGYPAETSAASAAAPAVNGSRSRPAGQRPVAQVILGDEQQIDVPRELQMLKPIVQQVDRGAELVARRGGRRGSGRADEHRHARERPRQHQRLVAG